MRPHFWGYFHFVNHFDNEIVFILKSFYIIAKKQTVQKQGERDPWTKKYLFIKSVSNLIYMSQLTVFFTLTPKIYILWGFSVFKGQMCAQSDRARIACTPYKMLRPHVVHVFGISMTNAVIWNMIWKYLRQFHFWTVRSFDQERGKILKISGVPIICGLIMICQVIPYYPINQTRNISNMMPPPPTDNKTIKYHKTRQIIIQPHINIARLVLFCPLMIVSLSLSLSLANLLFSKGDQSCVETKDYCCGIICPSSHLHISYWNTNIYNR